MTPIEWADGVNKIIRRSGTSWTQPNGVIEDATRSGKPKRRLATSVGKTSYSVKMIFSLEEYDLFMTWWRKKCKYGLMPFYFPRVDAMSGTTATEAVYQFVAGSTPSFSNPSGDRLEVTMNWEEFE